MTVRVASVPTDHVYVRHLSHPAVEDGVVRLPEPAGAGGPWQPSPVLDPDWLRAHADRFDLVHLHFGFDAQSPQALRRWADTLEELGRPLVLAVHDLRNPHHHDPGPHRAQLDVLVPAAAALVTLTPGAAARIARRWGRDAVVLPHPHVVPVADLARPRARRAGLTVGVHCKSLRPNADPLPVVETLARALAPLSGARLRVDVHTEARDPAMPRYDPALVARLDALAAAGAIDLQVHDYFTDAELVEYLISLDVSVLPYRFGTHSGWLEACHDLGTAVLAPDVGHYPEQRPCLTYTPDDPESLRAALAHARAAGPAPRATAGERADERRPLAQAHAGLYRSVLSREPACTS